MAQADLRGARMNKRTRLFLSVAVGLVIFAIEPAAFHGVWRGNNLLFVFGIPLLSALVVWIATGWNSGQKLSNTGLAISGIYVVLSVVSIVSAFVFDNPFLIFLPVVPAHTILAGIFGHGASPIEWLAWLYVEPRSVILNRYTVVAGALFIVLATGFALYWFGWLVGRIGLAIKNRVRVGSPTT
jgi:hypothetical protein